MATKDRQRHVNVNDTCRSITIFLFFISFITSNDFRRRCPFAFVMPTSKHKYQCFLILVQSFSAQCTFSGIYTFISFVIHFPFKWPRQEAKKKTAAKENDIHSNKKPRVFADEPL